VSNDRTNTCLSCADYTGKCPVCHGERCTPLTEASLLSLQRLAAKSNLSSSNIETIRDLLPRLIAEVKRLQSEIASDDYLLHEATLGAEIVCRDMKLVAAQRDALRAENAALRERLGQAVSALDRIRRALSSHQLFDKGADDIAYRAVEKIFAEMPTAQAAHEAEKRLRSDADLGRLVRAMLPDWYLLHHPCGRWAYRSKQSTGHMYLFATPEDALRPEGEEAVPHD
jgi:hypothetical protein